MYSIDLKSIKIFKVKIFVSLQEEFF